MIVLDLPRPMSVNETRKIDWRAKPRINAWTRAADALVISQGNLPERISGHYEVTVTLSNSCRLDADNGIKQLLDYVRRIGLVDDDSPRYLRKLTIEFGDAPEGCRVFIKKFAPPHFVPIGEAANEVVLRLAKTVRGS